jgi:signal transduction histidine kinase
VIRLTTSLRGRTLLRVAVGTLVSHLLGLAIYLAANASSISQTREQNVVDQLATLTKVFERLPQDRREEIANDLTVERKGFRLRLSDRSDVDPLHAPQEDTIGVRRMLGLALGTEIDEQVLADYRLLPAEQFGFTSDDDAANRAIFVNRVAQWFRFRETLTISVQLSDGVWMNARIRAPPFPLFFSTGLLLSLSLTVIVVFSITARAINRPLAGLARFGEAAEALGLDIGNAPPLDDSGPLEIRQAARAFNGMRDRIQSLIDDRTRMLAAMSHDFRTPLTRLRLRVEFFPDSPERSKMLRDIADMEEMVSVTLRFINDGVADEHREAVDFVSLLTELSIDLETELPEFELHGVRNVRVTCAPVSIRRAFTNLINNAKQYGHSAEIAVSLTPSEVIVDVRDHGPGVPESERDNVFQPFYRLEPSRSRESGGSGLGLAIARSVIRAHGGDITLHDAPGGGLLARVQLPRV